MAYRPRLGSIARRRATTTVIASVAKAKVKSYPPWLAINNRLCNINNRFASSYYHSYPLGSCYSYLEVLVEVATTT